jgi:tripartite-type tricarboxylate transporter receptor subunit TctC
LNKLNAGIVNAVKVAEFRERLATLGAEPISSTPQGLAGYLQVQTVKMRKAVADSGARPD